MWIDLIDVETGRETAKAIQLNLKGDRDYWVWCPKSCLRTIDRSNFKVTQIKKWIVAKNGWYRRKWCFGL